MMNVYYITGSYCWHACSITGIRIGVCDKTIKFIVASGVHLCI